MTLWDRQTEEPGLISRLAAWLQGGGELSRLNADEVDRMARDMGLPADQLHALAAEGPGDAALLHRRLAALGLTTADAERVAFGLTRALETDCACCSSKEQCRSDLDAQPEAPGWMAYCANATTLAAIAGCKGRAPV
jgi:hypothetical protein